MSMPVSLEDVQQAVALLQSMGVSHLCHDTDPAWQPYLPLCSDPNENDVSYASYAAAHAHAHEYHLRGTPTRSLFENDFATLQEAEHFYIVNVTGSIICVFGVALIAGLFLGLMTMDVLELRIIIRASLDEDEKLYASTILPIVEQRHLMLVTLLLINALFYETLPIFLDNLFPTWFAVLISVTFIMFFGEILPSGVFTGPHQLYLGYRMAWLTKFFMFIMYPFAKPLAMVLDYLVDDGEPGEDVYNREELSALVRIQYEDSRGKHHTQPVTTMGARIHRQPHTRDDFWQHTKQEIMDKAKDHSHRNLHDDVEEQYAPPLHQSEVDLIEGALQMKTVLIMDVYTPLSHMYAIPDDLVLDKEGFTDIYRQGYSRVPVYHKDERPDDDEEEYDEDKTRVLGFLMVRQLMLIDWDHNRDVSTLPLQRPRCISPRTNLVDGLRILRSQGFLMSFVCARPDLANKALDAEKPIPPEAGFMGIVTLQDIMESLLQERIYDEWDVRDRDRAVFTLQKWAANKLQDFVRKKAKTLRQKKRRTGQDGSIGSVSSADDESFPLLTETYDASNGTYSTL
jgi:metal transporter CNNM